MVNPKDKEKGRSRRLIDWDYRMICEWLQEPANKDSVFGCEKKTSVGKPMPSKNKAFVKLAEYINEHRSHKSAPIPVDGKAMGQRFRAYLSKYNETKKSAQSTGFGVDDLDYQCGIKTIDKLLEEMCPCYALMDGIFGKQPNIGVPIVRTTSKQGEPNVSAGSTSSGGSDGLLNMQDEEVDNYGENGVASQYGGEGDVGFEDDIGNPPSAQQFHDRDFSPPPTFNDHSNEAPVDPLAIDEGDTCILDKTPPDATKDKEILKKRGKENEMEDESHNAGSKKRGKGSKNSFSHQFEQSMEILCASREKLTDVVIADRRDASAWQKHQAEKDLEFRMAMEDRQKRQYEMEMSCRRGIWNFGELLS